MQGYTDPGFIAIQAICLSQYFRILAKQLLGVTKTDDSTSRWMSLRTSPVRSAGAGSRFRFPMQLQYLFEVGLSWTDSSRGEIHAKVGRGVPDRVYVQYRHGEASILQVLRSQVVLYSSVASGWSECQCEVPRSRNSP
jgi:hypothetical protein